MAVKYLTDPFVRNIQPNGTRRIRPDKTGRIEICDMKVTGLCLRVSAHGHKSWSLTYKMPEKLPDGRWRTGKQQRLTLGKYPLLSLSDARERALDLREKIDAGVDPKGRSSTFRSIAEACEEYVSLSLVGRVKYPHLTEAIFRNHVVPGWGERPLESISRGDAHQLLDEVKQGTGVGAAREVQKYLRAMYNWAIDREYVNINPFFRLRRPDLTAPTDVRTPLTNEKIIEMWKLELPKVKDQLRLILLTGCRKTEWGKAEWWQLDFDEKTLAIPGKQHKGGRDTIIPLSSAAMEIVDGLPGRISASPKEKIFGYYLNWSRLKPANERLSFHLRPHDLRATCATRMGELGIQPNVIQLCLGQSVNGLLSIYNKHAYLEERREAFEMYGNHIMEVVE